MKRSKDSVHPPDWLKVAGKDWDRMKLHLSVSDAEAAGYFFQQSLEKYLKAFLLEKGWKLRKIHELDALLDVAVRYNPNLKTFRDLCERVSGYYYTERYPALVDTELTCKDIEKDVEEAKRFIKALIGENL